MSGGSVDGVRPPGGLTWLDTGSRHPVANTTDGSNEAVIVERK
jgi:hypothetical protein